MREFEHWSTSHAKDNSDWSCDSTSSYIFRPLREYINYIYLHTSDIKIIALCYMHTKCWLFNPWAGTRAVSRTYIHVWAVELLSSPSSRHLHKVKRTTNLLLKVRQRLQSYSRIQTRLWVSFFSIRSIFECWELKNWAADRLRQSSHPHSATAVIFSRNFLVKIWRLR